jgi:hypothetical protein
VIQQRNQPTQMACQAGRIRLRPGCLLSDRGDRSLCWQPQGLIVQPGDRCPQTRHFGPDVLH